MAVLLPKVPQHQTLIKSVDDFLGDSENAALPNLSSGRMEFQLYKAALVMDTFMSRLEEVITETKAKAAELGFPVTCRKGCDACCSQPVSSSLFEAVLIQLYLESNSGLNQQFLAKYPSWRSEIGSPQEYSRRMQSALDSKISSGGNDVSGLVRKAVDGFNQDKNIGCPFLEEHSCSIYPVRPTACRQLLSIDDPLKCQTGEKSRLLAAGDIDELTYRKLPLLLNHLRKAFGFAAIINSIMPIAVHELLVYQEKYIEQVFA